VVSLLLLIGSVMHATASGVLHAISSALAPLAGAYARPSPVKAHLPLQIKDALGVPAKAAAGWKLSPRSK